MCRSHPRGTSHPWSATFRWHRSSPTQSQARPSGYGRKHRWRCCDASPVVCATTRRYPQPLHQELERPGWCRGRRPQKILEQILASDYRRRPRGITGYSQDAGLTQEAAPLIGGEFHTAKGPDLRHPRCRSAWPTARPGRCTWHPGTPKGVGSRAATRFEKHPSLGLHRIPQFGTPLGKLFGVRRNAVQISGLQPLASKIVRKGRRAFVGQHPFHLRLQDAGLARFSRFSDAQQLVVRHRSPEEVAQSRSQFEVGNLVHLGGIVRIQVAFDAKEEVRGNQDRLYRQLDALFPL